MPNLKELSFKSEALGCDVSLKIAAATLRTINKYGSIDDFLVNCRHNKLTAAGKKLKTQIKKKLVKLGKLEEVKIVKDKKTVAKKTSAKKAKVS